MESPEKIQRDYAALRREQHSMTERHKRELAELLKRVEALRKGCPHINTKSAQYSKWCSDCGESWDTY